MNNKLIITLVISGVVLILLGIGIQFIYGFVEDYTCSTTTDTKWYIEHNCLKYWED